MVHLPTVLGYMQHLGCPIRVFIRSELEKCRVRPEYFRCGGWGRESTKLARLPVDVFRSGFMITRWRMLTNLCQRRTETEMYALPKHFAMKTYTTAERKAACILDL